MYDITRKNVKLATTIRPLYSLSAANAIFALDGLKSAQIPKMRHTSLKKVRKRRTKTGIQKNMAGSEFMVCHEFIVSLQIEMGIDVVMLHRYRGTFSI